MSISTDLLHNLLTQMKVQHHFTPQIDQNKYTYDTTSPYNNQYSPKTTLELPVRNQDRVENVPKMVCVDILGKRISQNSISQFFEKHKFVIFTGRMFKRFIVYTVMKIPHHKDLFTNAGCVLR